MKRDAIFERLDPPPHGLASLRARMDARRRTRAVRRIAPFAFAVVLVVIALVVARRRTDPVSVARQHADTAEIALGIAPMPTAAAMIDDSARSTSAMVEVRTENPNVAFYWVSSISDR